jgi:hypothetical protein
MSTWGKKRREDTLDNTPVEAIQDLAGLKEQARSGCRCARVHIPAVAQRENIISYAVWRKRVVLAVNWENDKP